MRVLGAHRVSVTKLVLIDSLRILPRSRDASRHPAQFSFMSLVAVVLFGQTLTRCPVKLYRHLRAAQSAAAAIRNLS